VEHRWGGRVPVRTRIGIRAQSGLQGVGYIRDVSVSGALLVTGLRVPSMSFVRVFVPASVSLEAHVVRHTDEGFAVEWRELSPQLVRALMQQQSDGNTGALSTSRSRRRGLRLAHSPLVSPVDMARETREVGVD
jgi:hypothetical protein